MPGNLVGQFHKGRIAMKRKNPVHLSLLVAFTVIAAMAFAAPTAWATVVEPAGKTVFLRSSNFHLVPTNAYAEIELTCVNARMEFEIPANGGAGHNNNINRLGTGTKSTGPGSVSVNFGPTPAFEDCAWKANGETIFTTTISVNAEPKWAGAFVSSQGPKVTTNIFAFTFPRESFRLKLPPFGCEVSFAPAHAEALTGTFSGSTLTVDGQLQFEGCTSTLGASPSQFEATYVNEPEGTLKVGP
jgi:hypothetical protein